MNMSWLSSRRTSTSYDSKKRSRAAWLSSSAQKPGAGPESFLRFRAPSGSALMVSLLVMAICLTLGAGLLVNSRLFLQTHGFRKLTRLTSFAAENGIKQAWNRLEARVGEIFTQAEISQEFFRRYSRRQNPGDWKLSSLCSRRRAPVRWTIFLACSGKQSPPLT